MASGDPASRLSGRVGMASEPRQAVADGLKLRAPCAERSRVFPPQCESALWKFARGGGRPQRVPSAMTGRFGAAQLQRLLCGKELDQGSGVGRVPTLSRTSESPKSPDVQTLVLCVSLPGSRRAQPLGIGRNPADNQRVALAACAPRAVSSDLRYSGGPLATTKGGDMSSISWSERDLPT